MAGAGSGPEPTFLFNVRLDLLYLESFLICALVTALESLYASAIECVSAGVQRLCYGCGLISKGLGI